MMSQLALRHGRQAGPRDPAGAGAATFDGSFYLPVDMKPIYVLLPGCN